jgi:hypothetical protein
MSEAVFLELFASYEASVRVAARSLAIARALAEAHRSGLTPPDGILEAYFATLERDEAQLTTLRERAQRLRPDARLQT